MQTMKKRNWKEKLEAVLQRLRTQDIFWETEKNSNVLVAYGMLAVMVFLIVGMLGIYIAQLAYDYVMIVWLIIVVAFFLLPFPIFSICVKGDRRWLKYVLLLNSSIALVCLNVGSAYPYILLLVVPIALSTRYYSVGFTRVTAVVTGLLYAFSVWASLYFDLSTEYDLNYVALPAGSVLSITEGGWLIDYVSQIGIDKATTLKEMMLFAVPSRLLELALISAICVAVARRGHKMVLQQAEESSERAGFETELALAAEIQLSALPTEFPAFPSHPELDLHAEMHPAKEIGGDFYDFFEIDGDHTAMVMADVSGKGVPAAMFMMTGKTMIRDFLRSTSSPAAAMSAVNAQLCENNEAELFITAWIGVLEVSTGKLTYVNAGHCRPLLHRRGEAEQQILEPLHNLPLACFDSINYGQSEIQLCPGDEIFLYTDGVTEATDRSGAMYGTGHLKSCLNAHGGMSPQELLPEIKRDIDKFAGEEPQFDDITMLMLRLNAK